MKHAHPSLAPIIEHAVALGEAHRCPTETLAIGRAHGRVIAPNDAFGGDGPAPGLYRSSGERIDIAAGSLACGQVLSPARLADAAALQVEALVVSRRPTVAVVGVGTDAAAGTARVAGALLAGLVGAERLEPTAWPVLANDEVQVEIAIRDTACAFDVVLVHAADEAAMRAAGDVIARFGTVIAGVVADAGSAPRMLLARLDQACVLLMDGEPANVFAAWFGIGRALTDALQGRTERRPSLRAMLETPVAAQRPSAVPVKLATDALGRLVATPLPPAAFAGCDAVLLGGADAGAIVDVLPLH